MARAADAAWDASGGPPVDEATAAMAEAHSLQLCLLGLQHEISEISTGAAERPTPSGERVDAEAEADDGPVASQLFEGHQVLDRGGFRTLQHAFATREECAQAPCTRRAHTMCTPCAHRTLRTCHATRRVRAGARGGNIGHGPKLSSWRPDDLVHHTRAAREAGRMRCVFGRAVSRGGDGAGAGRCAARARRRPLPVRLATHPTRRPARGLARGTVGRRGPSAVVVVPQLRTALASRGWLSRVLAALRTLDEPPSRSRPNGRLRCGRWGPVEAPVEATDAAASCSQVQLALGTAPAVLERARRQAQRTLLRRLSAVRLARVLHALRPG